MKKLSIKARITFLFALVMSLLVAFVLTLLIVMTEHEERIHSRDLLIQTVQDSLKEVKWQDGEISIDEDLDYHKLGVYLGIYNEAGDLLFGRRMKDFTLPMSDGEFRTVQIGAESWYDYDTIVPHLPQRIWMRGVLSTSAGHETFTTMLRIAVVVLMTATILAAVLAYLLVARAFSPIRGIIESVEQITDGSDLSQRIALSDGMENGKNQDEIYRLAATFDRMLERLQASFERESRFSADVSHELRTPTAVMISQCEYALEHAKTLDEAKHAISTILEQAERMSALVGQLLLLSRAGQGRQKLHLESINLSELAELVAAQMIENAAEKHIAIHTKIEPDLTLNADETMLMRLLLNLMENGIKYGKEGGSLTITLRRNGDRIEGSVVDDGIGIAPQASIRLTAPAVPMELVWDFPWCNMSRRRTAAAFGRRVPLGKAASFPFPFPSTDIHSAH